MRIGIISDTHGLLRPEAKQRLGGVDHIIHAGDIGRPEIIDHLRAIAPVTAIRGNIDSAEWAKAYPATQTVELGGRRFHVVHDVHDLTIDPAAEGIDMVISGHSHRDPRWRSLLESRQCGTASLQAADHAGDARYLLGQSVASDSRSRRRLNGKRAPRGALRN